MGEAQIARKAGRFKAYKRVDFTSASLRTRRSRARLHQRRVIRRLKVIMWQIRIRKVKESQLICVREKCRFYWVFNLFHGTLTTKL